MSHSDTSQHQQPPDLLVPAITGLCTCTDHIYAAHAAAVHSCRTADHTRPQPAGFGGPAWFSLWLCRQPAACRPVWWGRWLSSWPGCSVWAAWAGWICGRKGPPEPFRRRRRSCPSRSAARSILRRWAAARTGRGGIPASALTISVLPPGLLCSSLRDSSWDHGMRGHLGGRPVRPAHRAHAAHRARRTGNSEAARASGCRIHRLIVGARAHRRARTRFLDAASFSSCPACHGHQNVSSTVRHRFLM